MEGMHHAHEKLRELDVEEVELAIGPKMEGFSKSEEMDVGRTQTQKQERGWFVVYTDTVKLDKPWLSSRFIL